MEINQRIFYLLEKQPRTAKELSDYIGVKPSSISAWKTEGSYPSSKHVVRISEFFDVSIEYLFTGKDPSAPNLNKQELELLETYNRLDSRGQHSVHVAIYEELDRMEKNAKSNTKTG